jgi:hypothetical protein
MMDGIAIGIDCNHPDLWCGSTASDDAMNIDLIALVIIIVLLVWLAVIMVIVRRFKTYAMRYRKLHPVTADMRRELSVAALAKAGGFRQPMKFPFSASRRRATISGCFRCRRVMHAQREKVSAGRMRKLSP